jgi:hypothetical protein
MYLISKLWYDPMENHNHSGYTPIGVTDDAEVVASYLAVAPLPAKGWPLKYTNWGNPVPVYKVEEIKFLQEPLTNLET